MTSVPSASQSMSAHFHHPHHCPCTSHAQPVSTQRTICLGSRPHHTGPDRCSKERWVVDGGWGGGDAPDASQSRCSLLAASWRAPRLMSPPPLLVPWAAVPISVWCLPSPLSMHGLSQNATRSLTDRWGLKQWGAI